MTLESELIEKLGTLNHEYLPKGNHVIKVFSKDEMKMENELTVIVDEPQPEYVLKISKEIRERMKLQSKRKDEINFLFTGNMFNVAEIEQRKWFLHFVSEYSNRFTTYFFNKKLKILSRIIDFFFTVFSNDGSVSTKCSLQHNFHLSADTNHSNVSSNLTWFDPNFASKGTRINSAYKIFYVLAAGTENPVVISSISHLIESRFITPDLHQSAKAEITSLSQILKQINFTDAEIKNIFEVIIVIIELSQYRAQGDEKKIEFVGSGHFKKAAELLLVKEKQLRDFVISEYSWQDNKRKLKSPKVINYEIDSFMCKLYEVLVEIVLDKYNKFKEIDTKDVDFINMRFLCSPSLPHFERDQVFSYGDYFQHFASNIIESIGSMVLENKVKTFIKYSKTEHPNLTKSKTQPINKTIFTEVSKLIKEHKSAKSSTDVFNKLEKAAIKEIKFLKINQQVCIDIYIPEFVSFIRFDWQSFVEGSTIYCPKQIESFLKMSGNSLLKNCSRQIISKRAWTEDDFSTIFPNKSVFDRKAFFFHLLVDESSQIRLKYPLKDQIINAGLQCLEIEGITYETFDMEKFVEKYRIVFLSFNDNSRSIKDSVQHAIIHLNLNKAWCSSDSIHLKISHVREIESLVNSYYKCVVKIQRYAKVIIAKIKLKKRKLLADQYRAEYLDAVDQSLKLSNLFVEGYSPIVSIDKENIDLSTLSKIAPSLKSIEAMKLQDSNYADWLHVTIMSETSVLHSQQFSSSKVCLFYSKDEENIVNDCLNIGHYLPDDTAEQVDNKFVIKISLEDSGDVFLDLKTKTPLFAWNVESSSNKEKKKLLPLSKGFLFSGNQYRILSHEYFIKKMAYNTLNNISYDVLNDLVQECSMAIILQQHPYYQINLTRSPLWIFVINCLPIINLQSTLTFNEVDRQRRMIDRKECGKYLHGLYMRPKSDWLTENILAHLMVLSLEESDFLQTLDSVDKDLIGRLSNSKIEFEKRNYKIRKYLKK